MTTTEQNPDYISALTRWRQEKDSALRAPDGWLTLIGLHWLEEGVNTVGSDADADVPLEVAGIPERLGTLVLEDGAVTLHVEADVVVNVDGAPTREARLRDSSMPGGPSMVRIGSVTFFIIERNGTYAVRARDSEHPARHSFEGRRWFDVDPAYIVTGVFIPHETARTLNIVHSSGMTMPIANPGRVEFLLGGQTYALEAFEASDTELWFSFKDATSGTSTYGAGRFLYAPLGADASVHMDFNKAYHPPCAFTEFATCPLPPKGNIIPVEIRAGEKL